MCCYNHSDLPTLFFPIYFESNATMFEFEANSTTLNFRFFILCAAIAFVFARERATRVGGWFLVLGVILADHVGPAVGVAIGIPFFLTVLFLVITRFRAYWKRLMAESDSLAETPSSSNQDSSQPDI